MQRRSYSQTVAALNELKEKVTGPDFEDPGFIHREADALILGCLPETVLEAYRAVQKGTYAWWFD